MGPLGGICRECDYFYVAFMTARGRKVINPEAFFKLVGGRDERGCRRRKIRFPEQHVFVRALDKTHRKFKNLDKEAQELIDMFLATV